MINIRFLLGVVLLAALTGVASAQNTLDPVFRVSNVNGDCQISLPGEDAFSPAQEDKAYPYGSRIRTGSRSSLLVTLSVGNGVRVLANADLVFDEDARDAKIKNIRLHEGEVEVELDKTFKEGGNSLNVETATAICGAVGTHFRVMSRMEQNLRIVVFRVIKGIIRVYGDNFEVAELKSDNWLSLLSPPDRAFLRLKNMRGNFDIRLPGEDGNDRDIPTSEGVVLKIWQREIPDTNQRVFTAVLTSPTGELIEEITITLTLDDPDGEIGWDEDPRVGQQWQQGRRDGDNPVPPEDFMDLLIDGVLDDINIEYRPGPSRPPTPTPVGRR